MTNKTRWTPGPWRLDEWRHVVGPDGRLIRCTGLALAGGNVDMEEPEANDVLIAAAPDLYAALEALASAVFEERPTRDAMGMAMNALNRVHGQE